MADIILQTSIPGTNAKHGKVRRSQGYSVDMIIEEFRILQVCILKTLQNNLSTEDFASLRLDIPSIAGEVDFQLQQTILSFKGKRSEFAA